MIIAPINPSPAQAMRGYRWKHRPLLVFAPDSGNAALADQRRHLADKATGLHDRDMVVVSIIAATVSAEFGPGPGMTASALRARYAVPASEFRAILVGKDGGAKLVSRTPLSSGRLFATIDAMPMRRQEMRRGSG